MVKPPQTSNPYNGKQSVYPKSIKESPDTTGYTVGGWWTPICVDLIEFNLLQILRKGGSVIEVTFLGHRCIPITDDITCHVLSFQYEVDGKQKEDTNTMETGMD